MAFQNGIPIPIQLLAAGAEWGSIANMEKTRWQLRDPYFTKGGKYRLNDDFEFDVDAQGTFEVEGEPKFGIGIFAKRITSTRPQR